jgi:hypothetical protein
MFVLFFRWNKITFEEEFVLVSRPADASAAVVPESQRNCTVAFLKSDMGDTKCEKTCDSMGASRYRWFDSGCCECVGHSCVSYGVNEAKCSGPAFSDLDSDASNGVEQDSDINYLELSDEELRRLEAEYGILDDDEIEESRSSPED